MLSLALRRSSGLLFTCLLLIGVSLAQAQDRLFTVQIGLFQEVRLNDFESLANMGFIYGQEVEDNVHQVYVGNFSDMTKATNVVDRLIQRNFRNATLLEQPLTTGTNVSVIQLATQTLGRPIDWPTLSQAGTLYVESDDQLIKIVAGVYANNNDAQADLARVRALGFSDAFVKSINNFRLVPVTDFETGIKEPLIPIQLTDAPLPSPPPTQAPDNDVTTYGQSATIGNPSLPPNTVARGGENAATATTAVPANATMAGLPNIRGNLRRTSAIRLQEVMKSLNYYTGSLDGYYGPGTSAAYKKTWDEYAGIKRYRYLTPTTASDKSDFLAWPEVQVLMTIADELTDNSITDAADLTAAGNDRKLLHRASQPITSAAASRAAAWNLTLWEGLNAWSAEDPLHANIVTALKVAYYQSQVRLEDYYMNQGFDASQAKDLGLATMLSLVGPQLERFL